ncbi:MAG: endonuclease [Bacteroidales bacterium]|nr:endonuclease [Bacteroidales bacterium]
MKKGLKYLAWTFLIIQISLFIRVQAQIPPGYYDSADGLQGFTLKTALYNIIKGHTQRSYDNLWTDFESTDKKTNGKVWDMYSDNPNGTPPYEYTFITDQCGNYGSENDCYNREHSMPKSWFNDAYPMYSDLFHLYPTDGYVNGKRSNYPFGQVGSASWTSMNGSKLGTSSYPGYSGIVFEPIDDYKGDFARTYFYMATRYENVVSNWSNTILSGNNTTVYVTWAVNLLLEWHVADPVSQKEIDRNNAIYQIQHNRNPYIDFPEWVHSIWGGNIISVTSIVVTSENNLNVISTPQGSLQMNAEVLPSNATNQNIVWSVENQSGSASISTSGLLTANNNGTVLVKASATDGSNVFGTKEITISNQETSITNKDLGFFVRFSPNPVVDNLHFEFNNSLELPTQIWISDISGKRIRTYTPESYSYTIDFQELSQGLYFLTLESNNHKSVFKILR